MKSRRNYTSRKERAVENAKTMENSFTSKTKRPSAIPTIQKSQSQVGVPTPMRSHHSTQQSSENRSSQCQASFFNASAAGTNAITSFHSVITECPASIYRRSPSESHRCIINRKTISDQHWHLKLDGQKSDFIDNKLF